MVVGTAEPLPRNQRQQTTKLHPYHWWYHTIIPYIPVRLLPHWYGTILHPPTTMNLQTLIACLCFAWTTAHSGTNADVSAPSLDSTKGLASSATKVWPVLIPRNTVRYGRTFLEQQRINAEKRRLIYHQHHQQQQQQGAVSGRAWKLAAVAWLVAEITQAAQNYHHHHHHTNDRPTWPWDNVADQTRTCLENWHQQCRNFWQVGRQPGGLLRRDTWTSGAQWTAAVQTQVAPKYQFALGAVLGLGGSPLLWAAGWSIFCGTTLAVGVAQCHRYAKQFMPGYFDWLHATKLPWIFALDDWLEDVLAWTEYFVQNPEQLVVGVPPSHNEGFYLPLKIQRGCIFGVCAGVLVAL